MPPKQTNAKLGTPAARGTPQPEDDEPGDAEVSLEQLAAVLHNIQNQLGGYGARLAAIERAGAEANAETDAAAGVGQGGVPPAPAPQYSVIVVRDNGVIHRGQKPASRG